MTDQCARVRPTKNLKTDLFPIDDVEPSKASREDVEMINDEDEEPLEADVPRARLNPMSSTSRKKQDHEDSGHAVCSNWRAACVEGGRVGGEHLGFRTKNRERNHFNMQ